MPAAREHAPPRRGEGRAADVRDRRLELERDRPSLAGGPRGRLRRERGHGAAHRRPGDAVVTDEEPAPAALAARPGMVKNRDQLMDAAYGESVFLDDRTIDSHIKRLRRKIKAQDSSFDHIETLYGIGYKYRAS